MSSSGNDGCPKGGAVSAADLDDEAWLAWVRASASDTPLGRIGPYELIEQIGRGGQGLVYRARQPQTGREVAIKRLGAGAFATPEMRARFQRETESAAVLDHPSIVTIFGSEVVDDQQLLIMRWIDGIPFDQWARPHDGPPRSVREVLDVFCTICSAIEHA